MVTKAWSHYCHASRLPTLSGQRLRHDQRHVWHAVYDLCLSALVFEENPGIAAISWLWTFEVGTSYLGTLIYAVFPWTLGINMNYSRCWNLVHSLENIHPYCTQTLLNGFDIIPFLRFLSLLLFDLFPPVHCSFLLRQLAQWIWAEPNESQVTRLRVRLCRRHVAQVCSALLLMARMRGLSSMSSVIVLSSQLSKFYVICYIACWAFGCFVCLPPRRMSFILLFLRARILSDLLYDPGTLDVAPTYSYHWR
jgi:hypothetical protein